MQDFPRVDIRSIANEELSIIELLKTLRDDWATIISSALVFLLVSLAVCAALPDRYGASVMVQTGRSGFNSPNSVADIEPAQQLIERINSRGFKLRLETATESKFSIAAESIKNTKLIRISVAADSEDLAGMILQRVLHLIDQDHDFLTSGHVQRLISSLQSAREQQKSLSAMEEQLHQVLIATNNTSPDPINNLVISQLLQQLTLQRAGLKDQTAILESSVAEQTAAKTRSVEPIQLDRSPIHPNYGVITTVALFGGVFVGIFLTFLKRSLKKIV
jgi:capsular polysaccharide biosynthesis protein